MLPKSKYDCFEEFKKDLKEACEKYRKKKSTPKETLSERWTEYWYYLWKDLRNSKKGIFSRFNRSSG